MTLQDHAPRGAARRGRHPRRSAVLRAQGQVRLTLGHGAAPGNPRSVAAERMATLLRERSNGRIEMRVAGSAQLGDDAAMLTALRTGTLDMSVNSQGASSAVLPELAALGLPFLFANAAAAYKVVDGADRRGAGEAVREGRFDRARLVGQRHPPHHQQQAPDQPA